jgi:hypothetical protein
MKKVVALKEILKAVESVEAEHRATHKKLMNLRKALKLLDPEAAIKVQAGKAMTAFPYPDPRCKGRK